MKVENIKKKEQVVLAIKGKDWGVTKDVPEDIITNFCEEMIGKEKNLFIKVDESSIRDAKKDETKINKINDDLNNYPVREIIKNLHKEENEN